MVTQCGSLGKGSHSSHRATGCSEHQCCSWWWSSTFITLLPCADTAFPRLPESVFTASVTWAVEWLGREKPPRKSKSSRMSRPVTRERGWGEEGAGSVTSCSKPVAIVDNPEAEEGEAASKRYAYEGLSKSLWFTATWNGLGVGKMRMWLSTLSLSMTKSLSITKW